MTFVRVRNKKTGHQYTTNATQAERNGDLQVINSPATNLSGEPIPPKYRIKAPTGDPAGGNPPEQGE